MLGNNHLTHWPAASPEHGGCPKRLRISCSFTALGWFDSAFFAIQIPYSPLYLGAGGHLDRQFSLDSTRSRAQTSVSEEGLASPSGEYRWRTHSSLREATTASSGGSSPPDAELSVRPRSQTTLQASRLSSTPESPPIAVPSSVPTIVAAPRSRHTRTTGTPTRVCLHRCFPSRSFLIACQRMGPRQRTASELALTAFSVENDDDEELSLEALNIDELVKMHGQGSQSTSHVCSIL